MPEPPQRRRPKELKRVERDGATTPSRCNAHTIDCEQDKAYTAVAFDLPTHQWHEFIASDPPLRDGIVHTPRSIVFGGGYPITLQGQNIGGIGVSGGHYTDDMAIASAALNSLACSPPA